MRSSSAIRLPYSTPSNKIHPEANNDARLSVTTVFAVQFLQAQTPRPSSLPLISGSARTQIPGRCTSATAAANSFRGPTAGGLSMVLANVNPLKTAMALSLGLALGSCVGTDEVL